MVIAPSVFKVKAPTLTTLSNFRDPADGLTKTLCRNSTTGASQFATRPAGSTPETSFSTCPDGFAPLSPFEEQFFGDTWKPRVSVGAGVNWNSPFGPFRIDFAQTIRKVEGDDERRFTFNVGTQF